MKLRPEEKQVQAIILAAGRGSRLGKFTQDRPKCLVEFQGEALIDRAVRSLRRGGIDRITVVVGYQPTALHTRLDAGVIDELIMSDRWQDTNMVATLMVADRHLRAGPALVVYSDIFFGPQIVRDLQSVHAPLGVAYDPDGVDLWCDRFADPLQDIEDLQVDPEGLIRRIGAPVTSIADPHGQFMGLLAFTPTAYSAMRRAVHGDTATNSDMTTALQRVIDSGLPVQGVPSTEVWGEIDSPEDLCFFSRRARHG